MPRTNRVAPGGVIFHVLNRGNGRMRNGSRFPRRLIKAAFLTPCRDPRGQLSTTVSFRGVMDSTYCRLGSLLLEVPNTTKALGFLNTMPPAACPAERFSRYELFGSS